MSFCEDNILKTYKLLKSRFTSVDWDGNGCNVLTASDTYSYVNLSHSGVAMVNLDDLTGRSGKLSV